MYIMEEEEWRRMYIMEELEKSIPLTEQDLEDEPETFSCNCPKCPCLMSTNLENSICEYCDADNHQDGGTSGASQFADTVLNID